MRLRRVGFAVVIAAAVLAACSADRLGALQADPMATFELPGAVEVRVSETPGSSGLGVPSPAAVRRTYTVPDGGVEAAIEALAVAAREAGWILEERLVIGYDGEKTLEGMFAQITIAGIADQDVVWVDISTRG